MKKPASTPVVGTISAGKASRARNSGACTTVSRGVRAVDHRRIVGLVRVILVSTPRNRGRWDAGRGGRPFRGRPATPRRRGQTTRVKRGNGILRQVVKEKAGGGGVTGPGADGREPRPTSARGESTRTKTCQTRTNRYDRGDGFRPTDDTLAKFPKLQFDDLHRFDESQHSALFSAAFWTTFPVEVIDIIVKNVSFDARYLLRFIRTLHSTRPGMSHACHFRRSVHDLCPFLGSQGGAGG